MSGRTREEIRMSCDPVEPQASKPALPYGTCFQQTDPEPLEACAPPAPPGYNPAAIGPQACPIEDGDPRVNEVHVSDMLPTDDCVITGGNKNILAFPDAGPKDEDPRVEEIRVIEPPQWATQAGAVLSRSQEKKSPLEKGTESGRAQEDFVNRLLSTDNDRVANTDLDATKPIFDSELKVHNAFVEPEAKAACPIEGRDPRVHDGYMTFDGTSSHAGPKISKEPWPKDPFAVGFPHVKDDPTEDDPKPFGDIVSGHENHTNNHLPSLDAAVKDSNPKDSIGVRKVGYSCLPTPVLAECGVAMLEGAIKYGRHNYRVIGVRASVYYDAIVCRHMGGWWEGEDMDKDSGMSHITKAITTLMVLRDAMIRGKMVDDRPPSTLGYIAALNKKASEIIDKYPDPKAAYTIDCQTGDEYQP